MEEKAILLKTIEGLNASIASLSATNKNQAEQIRNLQERIKELTAQVAWLNRQLFGRKSEKLRIYDPNIPDLFADEFAGLRQQAEEKRDEAVEKSLTPACLPRYCFRSMNIMSRSTVRYNNTAILG